MCTRQGRVPPGLGMTYRAGAGSVFTQEQNAGDGKIDTTEFETLSHPRDRERKRKGEGGTRQACHRRGGGWRRPLRGTREERKGAKPRLGQRTARRWGGDRPVRRPPPRQRTLTRATLRPAAHAPGWREFKSRGTLSRAGKCEGNIGGHCFHQHGRVYALVKCPHFRLRNDPFFFFFLCPRGFATNEARAQTSWPRACLGWRGLAVAEKSEGRAHR